MRSRVAAASAFLLVAWSVAPAMPMVDAASGCNAFGGPGWIHAHAQCDLKCRGPGFAGVHVAGITATLAPVLVAGGNGCGASCNGIQACMKAEYTVANGDATCAGDAWSLQFFGFVNMVITCWSAGCDDCLDSLPLYPKPHSRVHRIDAPDFDENLVVPDDALCVPGSVAAYVPTECVVIGRDSTTMFLGMAKTLPFALLCERGDCVTDTLDAA